jgi:hypothetical protein
MFLVTCARRELRRRIRKAARTALGPALATSAGTTKLITGREPVRCRAGLLAAGLAAVALLAAACGGAPSSSGSGGSPTAGASAQSQQLAFARCMRSHRVADFPDSGAPLQPSPGSDLSLNNPTYRAARQACHSLEPRIHLSPAQAAQNNADALKFAKCMREHGITKFPDPVPHGGSNDMVNLSGIDLNSPRFQAAQQACKRYQSRFGKG